MGTQTIPDRTNGQTIDDRWFNSIRRALSIDVVPRNTSGVCTTGAGTLGTALYSFLKAYISRGFFKAGDTKLHHSFNGLVGPGHGWMLCDGRQITEANYDAEHGAGSWATYVIDSPLLDRYLPDMAAKYPIGVSDTTKDCVAAPPASVGNAGNAKSLAHAHKWYKHNAAAADNDQTFDSNGNAVNLAYNAKNNTVHGLIVADGAAFTTSPASDYYTKAEPTADQDIQPDSIAFQYYMRII